MPAFAQKSGGFLTDQQITSLVDYLTTDYPNDTNAFHHVAGDPLAGNQFRPVAQTNTHAAATVLGPFEIK